MTGQARLPMGGLLSAAEDTLPTCTPIRAVLINDQPLVRAAFRMLIESWPGIRVVAESGIGQSVSLVESERPDIVLLDADMKDDGLGILRQLKAAAGDARIILLTETQDADARVQAVRMGAMGIVLKNKSADDLRNAIQKVNAGQLWLDRSLAASIVAEFSRDHEPKKPDPNLVRIGSLTQRERAVALLVCEGLQNEEIGNRLFISETTVRHHLTSIFAKLDVSNRFELIIFLYKHKFAKPPE
jgi:DNA-binding NarL/FixJ family response regulator